MERIAETGKQHEPSAATAAHARATSPAASSLPPALQLQQQAGNQAVQQLLRSGYIQAKLAISNPDDPEEREADNVAHAIMRKAVGAPASTPCSCSHDGEMCEECQQKQSQPTIGRRASAPSAPTHVPPIVSDVLRSPGHPLDAASRAFFKPRFGHDFSHVRVHTDSTAAASARSINAHAYAFGNDLVFGPHQYSPNTFTGDLLIAHELTHVLQQSASQGIRRQSAEGEAQVAPPVDTQSVKASVDVILKALKGITTSSDSAKILAQFQGKSPAFMRAILQELKSRSGSYDESAQGMVHWLFNDMTAEDRRNLRKLLMENHVLEDLGPILVAELTDALGLLGSSQDAMAILTQLGGADLDAILSQLETATKKSEFDTALYLFTEIDRVSAEKLRTHFIEHGNQRAWQYVASFTASKIHKLISGFLGLVSHSESTMVVNNFEALGSPALCQLTQQELDKLTRASDQVAADDRLFQKLDASDYDKLLKLPGLTLRNFVRVTTTTDKLLSAGKWALMVAEWTTCGVIGIATGLLSAIWDLVKGVWDIVTAAAHLVGCLIYLCSGFTVGSEDWLAVKDFFIGMGHVFKDPKAAWEQLWGELKAEFQTIEGPFADCKRAEFIVRKFIGVIVNIVLIFAAGYGLVKAGVSAVVEFSELAEEVGVIRALGQTAAKAGRAAVKFVSAKPGEIAEIAKVLGRPIETLMKVRKQLNGILVAVENEGVYGALRKRAAGLLENERQFWNENREAWKNRGLTSQQKQLKLEEEAGTIQNGLDTSQVPDNGTKAAEDLGNKADGLRNETDALENELTNDAPPKQTDTEAPPTQVTPEADRAFLNTTKKPTSELSGDEVRHELEIANRSPAKPAPGGEYVEEIPLSNEHEWKVKESGASCRFSGPPGLCFVNRHKGRPTVAPENWRIQFVDVSNLPDVVPPDVVLEFPDGERVWRSKGPDGGIVIESRLGPAKGRAGFEKDYFSRGEMGTEQYKRSQMERAHSQGQGTGFESPYAIPFAPSEVNQALQNTGIEMYLRFLESNKAPGVEYRLVTETAMHPGTRNMKFIRYRIDGELGGKSRPLFSLRINVEDEIVHPKVWIDEEYINPDPDASALLHFGDLPDDLHERLQMLFGSH